MAFGAIESRLAKLEERQAVKRREPERSFVSCVQKGREEQDEAEAFAAIGAWPTSEDIHVRWVVCRTKDDGPDDFKPWARVSPYGRRGAAQ